MTSVESSVFTALVIVILLASPPQKQTNKRWHGHRNSCGQLQRAQILIIIIQNKNKKYIYIYIYIYKRQRYKKKYSYIQQWTRQGLALLYFKQIDQGGGGGEVSPRKSVV